MSNIYKGTIKVLNNSIQTITSIQPGQKQEINVEITNLSAMDWLNDDVCPLNISYHWLKVNGENLVWDGIRTLLPVEILPTMKSFKTTMIVEAPKVTGKFILVLTMIKENIIWLEECGFEPEKFNIHIKLPTESNLLFIGNCQGVELARIIQLMTLRAIQAKGILTTSLADLDKVKSSDEDITSLINQSDLIFIHPGQHIRESINEKFPKARFKTREIPRVIFSAFHPDLCYIYKDDGKTIQGPMHDYQSAIAFYGWLNGYSVDETIKLFSNEVYQHLDYYNFTNYSKDFLFEEGRKTELPLEKLIEKWSKKGCWMHSFNHPKLFVLIDLAQAILAREGVSISDVDEQLQYDFFGSVGPIWPVYPEIGKMLGVDGGSYQFKLGDSNINLAQFVSESFDLFSKFEPDNLRCEAILGGHFQQLKNFIKKNLIPNNFEKLDMSVLKKEKSTEKNNNPYYKLPDYHFWRRALEQLPMQQVDPVVSVEFNINSTNKVATAGSCFAQHISRALKSKGFNYFVSETADYLTEEDATLKNYGVFSARFGNIYTSRQLLQLFDRAYDLFTPIDNVWIKNDGKYVDPYRPQIEPEGFNSIEDLEQSRAAHFNAVRDMFENLDIFVFTLGLTESWRNKLDGAVYPLAPGVVAGEVLPEQHEFVNFSVTEIVNDLTCFLDKLLKVNPNAKMILTVSPVPLIATYENSHVLTATTYSKSVLRVAAQEICKKNNVCKYFPSYEIITGAYTRGQYFEDDLRSVTQAGVDHVMRLFLQHYANVKHEDAFENELKRLNTMLSEVICDEEAIIR